MDRPPLPSSVRDALCQLARRVRRRQWLRAAAGMAFALGLLYLALLGLDTALAPSRAALRVVLVLAAAVAVALAWHIGLRPLRRRPDDAALAGLIERHAPELAERLFTLVALSRADHVHGSPAFVAALGRQTAARLATLDVAPVLAEFPMPRRAFLGCGALAVVLLALAWQPGHGAFGGRLLACCVPAPSRTFMVTPGDTHVLRGATVRLAVDVCDTAGAPAEPADVAIIIRQGDTSPERIALTATGQGSFVADLPAVDADLRYHVEADGDRSAEFHLAVVEPAALADPPVVRVEPPPYVTTRQHEQTATGRAVVILQYSRVRVACTFTRAPRHARLVLRDAEGEPIVVPLALDAEQRIGVADYLAAACGTFRVSVQVEVEHGLTSEYVVPGWTVRADAPPRFQMALRLLGLDRDEPLPEGARIAPDDVLRVETHAADDEGLAGVDLEYRVNDEPPRVERWLDGAGKTSLPVRGVLPLPAGLKDGDRLRFRLRATDNRRLAKGALRRENAIPAMDLAPQTVHEPTPRDGADRWVELRIDTRTDHWQKHDVAARHDELRRKLAEFQKTLAQEQQHVEKLKYSAHQHDVLTAEQSRDAAEAAKLNRALTTSMLAFGRELLGDPSMAPLAEHLLDVAGGEMLRGAQGLRAFAARERRRAGREQSLRDVKAALAGAAKKLNALSGFNDALARDRLDALEAERLAGRQDALRRWLERLLREKTPSEAEEELARLDAEQAKVEAELERLRAAGRSFQAAPAEQLARSAEEMAAEQRQAAAKVGPAAEAAKRAEQLQAAALKLAQSEASAQAKRLAKESAHALAEARQAMQAAQSMKEKGEPGQGKKQEEAALKLEAAAAKLRQSAEAAMDAKKPASAAAPLDEGLKQVKVARRQLETAPKQAPQAMRQAARALGSAAQRASAQARQALPRPAGRSGRPPPGTAGGGWPAAVPAGPLTGDYAGRSWGELPGELRARLVQDLRARYGDDYAEAIRRYFEQLAR